MTNIYFKYFSDALMYSLWLRWLVSKIVLFLAIIFRYLNFALVKSAVVSSLGQMVLNTDKESEDLFWIVIFNKNMTVSTGHHQWLSHVGLPARRAAVLVMCEGSYTYDRFRTGQPQHTQTRTHFSFPCETSSTSAYDTGHQPLIGCLWGTPHNSLHCMTNNLEALQQGTNRIVLSPLSVSNKCFECI